MTEIHELFAKAVDHFYAEEFTQAIELFEKILIVEPINQAAIEYIKKAIDNRSVAEGWKLLPYHAIRHYRMARSCFLANDIELATKYIKWTIEAANRRGIAVPAAEELLSSIIHETGQAKKAKVFISYSRKYDLEVTKDIYSFLLDHGCAPWMDIYELIPGQDWELEIIQKIQSSDYFIACLSRHSVSNRGYILKELKEAISILEQTPEGEIFLIPVRIDGCVVPRTLAGRQWLDWFAPKAKESLLKAVKSKK